MAARRSALKAGVALIAGAVAIAGCANVNRALGGDKVAPDEFRILTKAPLVVPPEYNLRPPRPGEPRPQELQSAVTARQALLGQSPTGTASDAEILLAAQLGANTADPSIRAIIDAESGGVITKQTGFANRILFWNDGDTADEADPLNAAAEEELLRRERLGDAATGGEDVEIRRSGSKLPGL